MPVSLRLIRLKEKKIMPLRHFNSVSTLVVGLPEGNNHCFYFNGKPRSVQPAQHVFIILNYRFLILLIKPVHQAYDFYKPVECCDLFIYRFLCTPSEMRKFFTCQVLLNAFGSVVLKMYWLFLNFFISTYIAFKFRFYKYVRFHKKKKKLFFVFYWKYANSEYYARTK